MKTKLNHEKANQNHDQEKSQKEAWGSTRSQKPSQAAQLMQFYIDINLAIAIMVKIIVRRND